MAEVDSAGGWSNYLGQAAALIVGEVILNRAGIRGGGPLNNKHNDLGGGSGAGNGSGSGGGEKSGDEGAGNARKLDETVDAEFIGKVKEMKKNLPSKIKK